MPTEKKAQTIDSLEGAFSRCSIGVLTDYRGLTTAELNELRRKLRDAKVEYRVVKNSLAQLAMKRAGREDLTGMFEGPVAVALGYGELSEPAKVLIEYIRASKSTLAIKGGFMGSRYLTSPEIDTLAILPSREILISQVMAGFQSPISGLVNVLAGPIRGIMGVLQARIQQLEGE